MIFFHKDTQENCPNKPCENDGTCFDGKKCICPEKFDGTTCGRCANGYYDYPNCNGTKA